MKFVRKYGVHALWIIPILFLVETAIRRMAEPDLFFYYALVEYYLRTGIWPHTDPFVYTLPKDVLMTAHQWLGYWIFYLPYRLAGWAGPILLKAFFVTLFLSVPLWPLVKRKIPPPPYFVLPWTLAIFIAHHRFRERVSLFGDLLVLLLTAGLLWWRDKRWFWYTLPPAFLLWAQLHPSWPLGWAILGAYFFTRRPSTWKRHQVLCAALCLLMPLFNPLGLEGLLYPFVFARDIEPYLRQYVVEWLPLTDPRLFPFRFLYFPFITLIPFVAWRLWLQRRQAEFLEWIVFALAIALNIKSVRFGLVAQGLFLLLIVHCELRRPLAQTRFMAGRWVVVAAGLLAAVTMFTQEYMSGSWRVPLLDRFQIEEGYFPEEAVDAINRMKPRLHIFNSFGFGGYLAWRWQGDPPIFFHGFSTDFEFYQKYYNDSQYGRAQLDAVIQRYDIGLFLLSKLGNDNAFINILRSHPDWQNIREDGASVIFAKKDPRVFP
jgi:hypothetical protein